TPSSTSALTAITACAKRSAPLRASSPATRPSGRSHGVSAAFTLYPAAHDDGLHVLHSSLLFPVDIPCSSSLLLLRSRPRSRGRLFRVELGPHRPGTGPDGAVIADRHHLPRTQPDPQA